MMLNLFSHIYFIYGFFGEVSIQILGSFTLSVILLLICRIDIHKGNKSFVKYIHISSQLHDLLFFALIGVFWWTKAPNFTVVEFINVFICLRKSYPTLALNNRLAWPNSLSIIFPLICKNDYTVACLVILTHRILAGFLFIFTRVIFKTFFWKCLVFYLWSFKIYFNFV